MFFVNPPELESPKSIQYYIKDKMETKTQIKSQVRKQSQQEILLCEFEGEMPDGLDGVILLSKDSGMMESHLIIRRYYAPETKTFVYMVAD